MELSLLIKKDCLRYQEQLKAHPTSSPVWLHMTIRPTAAQTRWNAQRKVILTVPYIKRKLARLVLAPEDEIASSTGLREHEATLLGEGVCTCVRIVYTIW